MTTVFDVQPPVVLISASVRNTCSSQAQIIAANGSKSFDYGNYVPEGYICIGVRSISTSGLTGGSVYGAITTGPILSLRAGSSAIRATGTSYTVTAKLICVRGDLGIT